MKIDNGDRQYLSISGVFEGTCGVSRGVIAFTPNRFGRSPEKARGAALAGEPILLTQVQPSGDGQSYTARYQALS